MKNIAIIGASYLQLPLIVKAKQMGYTTHVFAWAANDVGEKEADYFYPISIVEKEQILDTCKKIRICGICTISSDLAAITVNYVAQNLSLTSNSLDCTLKSTNKHEMRKCFEENGDPSPRSILVSDASEIEEQDLIFPLIIKPLDRSGSRGISLVENKEEIVSAIEKAKQEGFEKKALVEEYATGQEYSVECISWKKEHTLLSVTKKYTTGSPNFIETGHIEPAGVDEETLSKIKDVTFHALNSLGIEYGASHTEVKVSENGLIRIIEIGGRMGGDCIGSSLVELTTGYDFVKAVIDTAVGKKPESFDATLLTNAAIRFIMNKKDLNVLETIQNDPQITLIEYQVETDHFDEKVTDSSNRHGYFIFTCSDYQKLEEYMRL